MRAPSINRRAGLRPGVFQIEINQSSGGLPASGASRPCQLLTKKHFLNLGRAGLTFCLVTLALAQAQAQRPLGCDVSSYQPDVNWTQVTNAGMKFCWAKATQATDYYNPDFTNQEAGAKAAGLYIGAYHYAQPSSDPNITGANSAVSEANYYWSVAGSYVKYGGGYLVPMLDWEDVGVTNQLSEATMSSWVNEWCNTVSNLAAASGVVGVRPVVYTGIWYSEPGTYPGLNSTVTNWANWMSDYNGQNPQVGSAAGDTYPWPSWQIWQYNDTNTAVADWTGGDVDVYNGVLAGFAKEFVIGGTIYPTNISVELGSNATLSVSATGLPSTTFRWFFDGHLISGATSSNYTLTSVQLTNAGYYVVTLSNSYAHVASGEAFLSVLAPLTNATGAALAPASMVNWWTADGNANDIYGTNNATPINNLYYTNGEVGQAFHFDGSTAFLLPNGAGEIAPNWTLCLWVNRQNAPGGSAAIMGDSTYAVKLEQYDDTRDVGVTHSGVADYYFKVSLPQNQWTHLALVDNGSQLLLYTNGVFASSQLYSNSVAVSTPSGLPLPRACIGADELANGAQTDFMLGSLDEIQTYQAALTAAQIASIYAAGSAGLVRAPQFAGIVATNGNSQVQLDLIGLTGKNITLYSSTNLLNWASLGVIANPTGAVQYVTSPASPQIFYRAAQP